MKRGEVWWAELPAPAGRRPVLLLSRNRAIEVREAVTVAVITRTVRRIPTEVPIGTEDGMPRRCIVNLDDIHTVPKTFLRSPITRLSMLKMDEVALSLKFALGVE